MIPRSARTDSLIRSTGTPLEGSDLPGLQEALRGNSGLLNRFLTLSSESMEKGDLFRLVISIGNYCRDFGDYSRAEELYTLGLDQWSSGCPLGLLAEALLQRGDVYRAQGKWREATADFECGRRIYLQLNVPVAVGRVENILGLSYALRGKIKRAKSYIKHALQSFEHFNEVVDSGIAQMNLGVVSNLLGDYDAALSSYQRARSHFEEVGDPARLALLHYRMGMTFLAKCSFGDATRQFDRTASLGKKAGSPTFQGLANLGRANILFALGDVKASLKFANHAREALSTHDHRIHAADLFLLKGKIYRSEKRFELAEWYFHTSLSINQALENQYGVAECYRQLGALYACSNKNGEARVVLEKSLRTFRTIGALHDAESVLSELTTMGGYSIHETRGTHQE
ncbi:MAG: tetratricopeptide repeat protein [Bacteroidetes bacterium]|nr:tetratricopeptide repeat protein [Bacteroidota bacterium]MCW5894359.1 tetratricopeptide repeat protein [Bacteroidota bacterium]